jgi:hypothetical protein
LAAKGSDGSSAGGIGGDWRWREAALARHGDSTLRTLLLSGQRGYARRRNLSSSVWSLPLIAKATVIKPARKAIRTYYQTLQTYREERVEHEGATETAFQQLLADTARPHGWTLLPKLNVQVKGKNIFPDGTLRDFFNFRRGF